MAPFFSSFSKSKSYHFDILLSFGVQVCSKLSEKFGKHESVKPKQAMRSLATPLRMYDGMDEEEAPKKKEDIFEGPLLSERDRQKIERRKRKDERQREVTSFSFFISAHVAFLHVKM